MFKEHSNFFITFLIESNILGIFFEIITIFYIQIFRCYDAYNIEKKWHLCFLFFDIMGHSPSCLFYEVIVMRILLL